MRKIKIVNKVKFFAIASFIFLFFVVLAGYAYLDYQTHTPLAEQGESQVFLVESGQGLEQIAGNLEKAGLIRGKYWFIIYVYYKGWAGQLQAGEYTLSPAIGIPEIVRKIVGGEINPNEVIIVIPEGFNLRQIDARLAKFGLINPGELVARKELEGYLFPDTYRFSKNVKLDEIILVMRDNLYAKLNQDGLSEEIQRQGKTLKQILTMASIVGKEVPSYYEKRVVSGIFWNRLEDNYPLQSCATIAYALGVNKWIYSIEDTKIDSPYNTYQRIGLPPGPINNPGLDSIKAAVYPIKTDYYFFLSSPSGQTIFSRTVQEHQANKEQYLR